MIRNSIIRKAVVAALALASLGIAGCAVDQGKEVGLYRQVLDGPDAPPVQALAVDAPLSLQRSLELANANNEQLAIKGENYVQALIAKDRAAAAFLPTISLTPSFTAAQKQGSHVSGGAATDTVVPVSGGMNLFNGFRDLNNVQAASASIEQSKQLLLDLQQTILLDVAQTYYQVLKSEKSVDVLQATLAAQDERIRQAQAQLATGQGRMLDMAQAQSDESATRVTLVSAQNDVRNGRSTLATLLGVPQVMGLLTDGYQTPAALPGVPSLLATADATRQDTLAAQAAVEAAKHGVNQAVGQYYPSVSVDVQKILTQAPTAGLSWSSMITANIPIFSAGIIEADVRTAWSQLRQSEQAESLVNRQVQQDVQIGAENFNGSTQRVKELQTEVAAAQQANDLADRSYQLGAASNLDRLTALDELLSAQLQLVSEQFNQKVTYLDLLRAMGQLRPEMPAA